MAALSKLVLIDPALQQRAMRLHDRQVENESRDYFTSSVTPTPNRELRMVFNAALHRGIALGMASLREELLMALDDGADLDAMRELIRKLL